MEVFWASGYDAASIPKLTNAMGISAQSLYAAFGSKDALYREAMEFYRTSIGAFATRALESESDAIDAVIRVLKDAATTFSRTEGTPGCMIATPFADTTDISLNDLGRSLRIESVEKIADRLLRGIDKGQVGDDVDCRAWARYIGTVVQGMSVQARDGASIDALANIAQIAAEPLSRLRRRP